MVSLPFVGWLFKFLIVFFGLGALWLWGARTAKQANGLNVFGRVKKSGLSIRQPALCFTLSKIRVLRGGHPPQ